MVSGKDVALSAEQLAGLEVKWFEDEASKWSTQGLKIVLPVVPRVFEQSGTPYSSEKDFGYWVDAGKLKDVHAALAKFM